MADRPELHYTLHGRRDDAAPALLLSSGLGGAGQFWTPQLEALGRSHRLITYDHRGTGKSPGRLPADYSVTDMAQDVIRLLDALDMPRVSFMGHALGGLIGLELAHLAPERLDQLVVINGWAAPDPHTARCFRTRLTLLEQAGMAAWLDAQPLFLYPADWLSANARHIAEEIHAALDHPPDADNLRARVGAATTFDLRERASALATETLVIATRDDLLVPWTRARELADALPRARLELLDYGGHGVTVTAPDTVNALVTAYLTT
ncbi:aminoacrylate hydrolase [Kushneria sinocarnis]|uniref:Putative carbamate hydrolase RutD n=1 Tax=Kushneria sinocarnis TaxID=595502 RepID=A0A420X1G7_9GAMM|nr:pyrimidine utilization protein D [Kushneria sinocarnis]RKR07590.1 aminoacrylate hydrolase [Kushneria sinocarnis]